MVRVTLCHYGKGYFVNKVRVRIKIKMSPHLHEGVHVEILLERLRILKAHCVQSSGSSIEHPGKVSRRKGPVDMGHWDLCEGLRTRHCVRPPRHIHVTCHCLAPKQCSRCNIQCLTQHTESESRHSHKEW